jgi:hypothetical protein
MYQSMEGFDYREMEGEEQTFAPPYMNIRLCKEIERTAWKSGQVGSRACAIGEWRAWFHSPAFSPLRLFRS